MEKNTRRFEFVKWLPSGHMKGQSLILPAITLALILILLWSLLNIPLLKSNEIERNVETRSQIHIMGNALDAAKLYMETALEYSIYQACYDNLKKGGWDSIPQGRSFQGFALWDSSPVHPDQTEFETGLGNSIRGNLGYYQKSQYRFLSDYYVSLPSYTIAVFTNYEGDPRRMLVVANSEANLNIQKNQESGEYIRLEKDSTITNDNEYRMDCYGVYLKGVDTYNLAKVAVEKALADTDSPAEITAASPEELNSTLSALSKGFADKVASLNNPYRKEGDYEISVTVLAASLNLKKLRENVTADGVTAELSYAPEANVRIEVTNPGQNFPVYDGYSVVFSPVKLVFVGKYSPATKV